MKIRTNRQRAEEGLRLCGLMMEMTGVDELRDQIADAIAQLMHTCRLCKDEEGDEIDFEECLATARMNFEAECDEDPDDMPDALRCAGL